MKKSKIMFFLSSGIFLLPVFTISCVNKHRPTWDLNNQNNKYNINKQNANYETNTGNIEIEKDNWHEGNFDNVYGITQDQILNVFKNFKFELTEYAKSKTSDEIYKTIRKVLSEKLLPKGVYFKEGRESFEELFNNHHELKKIFKITWPEYSEYDENFYEVRYSITNMENGKKLKNSLIVSATFYHSNKNHIDRNIQDNIILNRHDTGVGVGPTFYYRIIGFK